MRKTIDMTVTVQLDYDEDVIPFESAVIEFVSKMADIDRCGERTLTTAVITDVSNINEVPLH